MSSLVIGGLFAIAILAIIGLVFLIRSEKSATKTQVHPKTSQETLSVTDAAQTAQGGLAVQPAFPSSHEETIIQTEPVQPNVQHFPVARGQFHSLSVELHALYSQAQDIEHRISQLTDVIEHAKTDQNRYVNLDSQEHPSEVERASKN